jgi:hypothetical protein
VIEGDRIVRTAALRGGDGDALAQRGRIGSIGEVETGGGDRD